MQRLTLEPRGSPGRLLGLEHEFRVLAGDRQADFRGMIHGLGLGQPNLDPADPNAYRLPSGAALTCDGREAEIALPPIAVRPGFGREVRSRAAAERRDLLRRLGPNLTLDGCSTHISVSATDEATQAICRLYATTFAPALMLLMDRRESPGLLVRPRPGRVELGGEYVAGDQLGAAATFAVGSILACERALRDPRQPLPPVLDVRLEPARARYGWYVDRKAFGGDLYATGRSTILTTRDGDRFSAQVVLERAWAAALAALDALVETEDERSIDALVSGRELLPCETTQSAAATHEDNEVFLEGGPGDDPFGSATRLRTLRVAEVAPVMLTWDLAVFVLLDRPRGRTAFAAVPRGELAAFLDELDAGRLDGQIHRFLARRRWSRSHLEAPDAVSTATLFDELGPRLGLVPAEYGPDGRPVAPLELLAGRAA
jgi:hypothetical protein